MSERQGGREGEGRERGGERAWDGGPGIGVKSECRFSG